MNNLYTPSSRYYQQKVVSTITNGGRSVIALNLRIIPPTTSRKIILKETDRLDIIAQELYDNPTKFWHIADVNCVLDVNELITDIRGTKTIKVPEY